MNALVRLRPEATDPVTTLKVQLQSFGIEWSGGKLALVSSRVPPVLSSLKASLPEMLKKPTADELDQWLVALWMASAKPAAGDEALDATLEMYSRCLGFYPVDLVYEAISGWPERERPNGAQRWFPALADLLGEIRTKAEDRAGLCRAIDRWNPTYARRDKVKALRLEQVQLENSCPPFELRNASHDEQEAGIAARLEVVIREIADLEAMEG